MYNTISERIGLLPDEGDQRAKWIITENLGKALAVMILGVVFLTGLSGFSAGVHIGKSLGGGGVSVRSKLYPSCCLCQ